MSRTLILPAFNQRDIAGILAMIRTIGVLVGALVEAEALAQSYEARLNDVAASVRGRREPKRSVQLNTVMN
jgi:iron complex transport system substrate-binding protein